VQKVCGARPHFLHKRTVKLQKKIRPPLRGGRLCYTNPTLKFAQRAPAQGLVPARFTLMIYLLCSMLAVASMKLCIVLCWEKKHLAQNNPVLFEVVYICHNWVI